MLGNGKALAMHDCLFRNRETARWVWYHDLDEYLEAPPTSTVPGILRKYMFEPYLTHGSYVYSMDNCEVREGVLRPTSHATSPLISQNCSCCTTVSW